MPLIVRSHRKLRRVTSKYFGRGAALVELALVLPLFLGLMAAIFGVGFVSVNRLKVATAAQGAADEAATLTLDSLQINPMMSGICTESQGTLPCCSSFDGRVCDAVPWAGGANYAANMNSYTTCRAAARAYQGLVGAGLNPEDWAVRVRYERFPDLENAIDPPGVIIQINRVVSRPECLFCAMDRLIGASFRFLGGAQASHIFVRDCDNELESNQLRSPVLAIATPAATCTRCSSATSAPGTPSYFSGRTPIPQPTAQRTIIPYIPPTNPPAASCEDMGQVTQPNGLCCNSGDSNCECDNQVPPGCWDGVSCNSCGSPSGGTPSGGTPSGGTPSGGTPSGGTPSGGTPSGGTPSGGMPSGGTPSGGTPSGGSPSGGGDPCAGFTCSPTCGACEIEENYCFVSGGITWSACGCKPDPVCGGTPSGGTPSGGTPSGGTPSGGTPSGGTPSGGTPSGCTPADCSGWGQAQDPGDPCSCISVDPCPGETDCGGYCAYICY